MKLVGSVAIVGTLFAAVGGSVLAQIAPDNTLGAEGSVVTPNVNIQGIPSDRIDGGATRGANLFHSFGDFNVGEGRGAYFTNPTGIENILTRVTGSNASNIFGRLGVLGGANLFLLNPNGIVFGPNASLDIQGSFVATTAEGIQLGDSGYFSAAQPQTSSLLSVSPGALFFNAVANQPTSIINQGNLATGKNLTLLAGNLDLQGQLLSGGDLTLEAQDTVKVRDSAAIPFIASAGGNLLVQGNHRVDIFALTRPESGFFSGGDMVLRSSNTVGGDAHYWSEGNFRIEQLDGSLGNLFSPHDPIIRASGDVFINAYQGASLHILAGGKVEIPGYVWIQGADPENGLVETVNLADGTTISIDGKNEPTLDIRAGVNQAFIGSPFQTGTGTFFQPVNFPPNNPSSADIKIGTILFTSADNTSVPLTGRVLLTNQYQPNVSFSGDIQVTDTQPTQASGAIFTTGGARNPSVAINSRGGITIDGTVNTSSSFGDGGAIALTAGGNISTEFLNSNSSKGNGGAIAVTAGGNFTTFNLFSGSFEGNGGAIAITAGSNIISTRYLDSSSLEGNGGAITITAGGNFTTFGLFSGSFEGNGGAIAVTADGNITLQVNSSAISISDGGNGGAITLRAGGNITANDFYSNSYAGNGGAITLTASGNVTTGNLNTYSLEGNGGAVSINSTNGRIVLQEGPYGQSLIDTTGVNGGNVALSSPNANFVFENPSDYLFRASGIDSSASNGSSGNIQITAPSVTLSDVELNTSARGQGNAGSIFILTDGLVALDGSRLFTSLEPEGIGRGGDITIDAGAVSLSNASFIDTATFGQGNAGNVSLQVDDSVSIANDSAIFSFTSGQGNGGHVKLEAGGVISLTNRSNISTAVNSRAQGDGGDIEIRARSLSLTGGSQLVTSTSSSGKAGDITVSTIEGVFISGTDPNFIPPKNVLVGNPPPLAEVEPNNSITLAQPLTQFFLNSPDDVNSNVERSVQNPYVFIAGTQLPLDNKDFYSFEVTAPGTRGIFRFNASYDTRPIIRIYNGSGELLTLNPRLGSDVDVNVLRYVFSEPGIYYVNPKGSPRGAYTFQVSLETPNVATSVVNGTLPSGLFARTEGAGMAGNITINTPLLTVTDGGNVSATATAAATSTARSGNIELNTSQINLQGNNSGIFAQTEGAASAGSLRLQPSNNGQSLTVNLQDDAQISASTSGSGQGGNLIVTAPQAVTINGDGKLSVETTGAGQAGDVTITTDTLKIDNGATVSATATATATTSEPSGSISVNANQVNLSGTGSGLLAETQGAADAGALTLQPSNNGQSLTVNLQDDAKISASTSGSGRGGNLLVTAPQAVTINGNGQLSVETSSTGVGGNLTIETQRLTIQDGTQVSASTSSPNPDGEGGNITVNATQSLDLNQASLLAQSTGAAPAGNVTINTPNLTATNSTIATSSERSSGGGITVTADKIRLWGDSDITTNVNLGAGGGGNIYLEADSILAFDDSDILAFARDGRGGDITLNTRVFFGFAYSPAPKGTDPDTLENNNQVDINASGAVSGVITTPDVSFIQNSLTELPDNQINTDSLLANSCIVRRNQPTKGSFTITGTGGLPQRPGDAQMSTFPTVDIETLPSDSIPLTTNQNRPWQKGDPIVEPQGVYRLPNGKLVMSRECP
nr:filamentous hemagglutinin N-terminal domain-containing protein [Trichocoleus sp. FACHB-40]